MARVRDPNRPHFPLLGEPLALDLVNTEVTVRDERVDLLASTRWWRVWLDYQQHRIEPLLCAPITNVMRSATTLREVRAVRAAARGAIDAARTGRSSGPDRGEVLCAVPGHTVPVSGVPVADAKADAAAEGRRWLAAATESEALCAVLAREVMDLVTSPLAANIRQCSAPGCAQLFLAGHTARRWCSSWTCGNRARAARHYHNRRADPDHTSLKPGPEVAGA